MKKRIIAFVLVVVMAVMALAGCGSTVFNYAEEDLTQYAAFDKDAFAEALAAIEIEDFDFTTDETVRAQKVLEKIYNTLTDKVVAVGDKEFSGVIGERDVVYYNMYATVEKDGTTHTVFFDLMEEARLNNSSYKSSHVIELGKTVSSEDELANEFREKLAAALKGKTLSAAYSTDSTKGTKLEDGQKVVISYKLDKVDSAGNKDSSTVKYKEVTLGSEDGLLTEIIKAEYKNSVGNAATFKDGANKYITTDASGNTLTYSNVVVKWIVKNAGEDLASFSMVRYKETKKVRDINDVEVELKDLELTYHVYPVSIIHVPEYDATALLKYILGEAIKTSSLEIFEDESYTVTGGKKLSELVEELGKIYAGTTEDAKYAAVKTAKEAYDSAKAAVDAAGKNATEAQKDALEDATEALKTAKKTAADTAITEILTAASTADGAKPIAEAITSEYDEDVRHGLEEEYNTSVIKAVAKKVYEAIDESVEVTAYPESVLNEAYNRLFEAYEYSFYKDKHGSESEYSFHKGDFADFLKSHAEAKEIDGDIWRGIEAAITKEAKEKIAPVIKIYVVAKALKDDAKVDLAAWAELDKTAGRFDIEVDREDYEDEEKYNEAVTKAEESETKAYENAKKEADRFLVTNDVFNQYKNDIGNAAYESFISDYGEANLRTALQFEKIMNYLMSTSIERVDGHNHPKYTERDGVLYIDFRYEGLTYVTVEDADGDEGADD